MGLKAALSKPLAAWVARQQYKWAAKPVKTQENTLQELVRQGCKTVFGQDHDFRNIHSYEDFKKRVPIRKYEDLVPYVDRILNGEPDVLWPGRPAYLAKTSGTTSTSGVKYIPITKASIPNHINSARNALLSYIHDTGNTDFLNGKMIFLSGSPELYDTNGIPTGRLSGLVNHHVPSYLQRNQLPTYETNCVEDWEEKLEKVIEETIQEDMRLISGIPPWVQMYFDRLMQKTGKHIKDLFPNFSLFVYGGVNFEPYRGLFQEAIGRQVDSIETYPASEGFIAYSDKQDEQGMLLLLNSGIFYEFIPMEEYFQENPTRLSIGEVEVGKNYALIINNNAGLWGYSIGDTVKFVSTNPYRLVVTGRVKHFISAFGEHVIAEEVERAMQDTLARHSEARLTEFTVAPVIEKEEGASRHEWLVEFDQGPEDLGQFAADLDKRMCELNIYYDDLVSGSILSRLQVVPLQKGAFQQYMKSQGKLGGQNKVPRLANDRVIADELIKYRA